MASTVSNLQILIASPSDLKTERDTLREALFSLTSIIGYRFQPIMWEFDLPSTQTKDIQKYINDHFKDCDIVITLFKGKIGTRTPRAESGTVEEFLRALSSKKPVITYFLSNIINTSESSAEEIDQLQRLKTFKDACRKSTVFHDNVNIEEIENLYLKLDLEENIKKLHGLQIDPLKKIGLSIQKSKVVSWSDFVCLTKELYNRLKKSEADGGFDFDIILAINKCGLMTGVLLGRMCGPQMQVVGISCDGGNDFLSSSILVPNSYLINSINNNANIRKILIIDTVNRHANTFPKALEYLKQNLSADKQVKTALLVSNSLKRVACDYLIISVKADNIRFPYNSVIG